MGIETRSKGVVRHAQVIADTVSAGSRTISVASYTLLSSDDGKVLYFTSASAVTLTVPPGLRIGFSCALIQGGAGQVTPTPGAGVTIANRSSYTKTAGQNAIASLIAPATNTFFFGGDGA